MNFELILVSAGAVTGLIWLFKNWMFPSWVEFAKSFFPVILIVLALRSFVIEPFRIPSGSMLPTLLIGDFIVVNKFTYGLRLPVTHTKFLEINSPARGDIMVFRHPKDKVDYIKRVIGIPGDVVHYHDKKLTINGKVAFYAENGVFLDDQGRVLKQFEEQWKFDTATFTHQVILDENIPFSSPQEWVVPVGHYFVLGDNRDNSNDGRFWGMVPEENLVGKAFGVWMSWSTSQNGWFPINLSRIGRKIQ